MRKGLVYRCYDQHHRLLYIGSTMNTIANRIQQHRRAYETHQKSAWIVQMANVRVDEYPSWQEALVAEAALIAALDPEGNTQERRREWRHSPAIDQYRAEVLAQRTQGRAA